MPKAKTSEPKIINFQAIEKKWQRAWESKKAFVTTENSKKKKFYVLEMFPYPSASGLHMGHAFNYTIGDIYARYMRMLGYNVLYPMGYDAFGLPAENAAIKENAHPKSFTEKAISRFIEQQKALGLSYDWSRMIKTSDPEYYKWNQYFFLQFLKNGLVYRKKSPVNFCPKCCTVLANEQVHSGKCWRHPETTVEIKSLEQWFIKTTKYADELLENIEKLDWPKRIKIMQENWISRSEGTEIFFEINGEKWPIFTTRPDTLFGVTFMVVSAQHPKLSSLIKEKQKSEVEKFLKRLTSTKQSDIEQLEKEGAFTGSYATNPLSGEKVPIYAGNFVIADYGSGMVMAVPAHDQRDFEFAKKYKIPIKIVIRPENEAIEAVTMDEAYTGAGKLINSQGFDGLFSEEAKAHITKALEYKKLGKPTIQYKLRDWLVSRQRYWGTPIPVIYCNKCGIVPVPEKNLPITLPEKVKFGSGNPLASNKEFLETICPKCKSKAKRETDTMDTFFDSSWYFLRYTDPENKKAPFDKKKAMYWNPVNQYIGGAEHAVMHLIYARFFTKALRDLGFIKIDEPFQKLFNQGMLHGEDGAVMSKSRGNVIDPLEMINKYGADTLRLFLVSLASPDKDMIWSNSGIEGIFKLINRIKSLFETIKVKKSSPKLESTLNKTIKSTTSEIENFRYNFAVINLREILESLESEKEASKDTLEKFLKLLHPFCPHITEELWSNFNKSFISLAEWPKVDESKINEKFDQAEKSQEKTLADIQNILRIVREKSKKEPKSIYLYTIPKELSNYNPELLSKKLQIPVKVFANNDKSKIDPQNKASKAQPNRPAIYIE